MAPERRYLPNYKQASLLAKTSWGSGESTSAWEGALVVHPENQVAGTGEAISCSDPTRQTPDHLSCSDLGRAQNAGPIESAPLRTTWGPEPEWLNLRGTGSPGLVSDGSQWSNLEPEQCGQGRLIRCERWQAQCGWDTASTHQCFLFAASLPPHSATEQVSLKKVSTTAPLVSGWKSDTEETSKQKKLK